MFLQLRIFLLPTFTIIKSKSSHFNLAFCVLFVAFIQVTEVRPELKLGDRIKYLVRKCW